MAGKKIQGTQIRTMRISQAMWKDIMPKLIAARGFGDRSELMRFLLEQEHKRYNRRLAK